MSDNSSSGTNNGIGFATVLFLVFLVLKLIGVIDWSWWWVTAPLWAGFVIVLVGIAIAAAFVGVRALIRSRRRG
jgi:hypothetical protein